MGIDWTRCQEIYDPIGIIGYADSNYIRDLEQKKSITGYCFFLAKRIIIWCSRPQQSISISTF